MTLSGLVGGSTLAFSEFTAVKLTSSHASWVASVVLLVFSAITGMTLYSAGFFILETLTTAALSQAATEWCFVTSQSLKLGARGSS